MLLLQGFRALLASRATHLFFVATLFMFLFQLETRLVSYVYLFHESILLIESILLGGGFVLAFYQLPVLSSWRRAIGDMLPLLISIAFAVQVGVFFTFNIFYVDVLALSILFGLFFLQITHFINLPARTFYGAELLGSFAGVALYALAVMYVLEEQLLMLSALALFTYVVLTLGAIEVKRVPALRIVVFTTAAVIAIGMYAFVSERTLPEMFQCNPYSTSYTYKSACLDDSVNLVPEASFTHLKGRTDLYVREDGYGRDFLEAKNTGYRVSAANQELLRGETWFDLLEHRIPKIAYKEGSKILSIGAGAGSYVQAFQTYVTNPDITAVEIDKTVDDVYADGRFGAYLPDRQSYTFAYGEGRRFVMEEERTYDVITVAIEGINSSLPEHVDERSSLLYTKEALAGYLDHLTPDGYVVLENYYPDGDVGDAMVVKFLSTLADAVGDEALLSNNLILYSWRFHPNASAQRFVAGIYSKQGFTEEDFKVFADWSDRFQVFAGENGMVNPHAVTPLHIPANDVMSVVTYTPFFDTTERTALSTEFNTSIITDSRPFRHMVTTLPFPPVSYAFFGLFTALFLAVLGRVAEVRKVPAMYIILSALFGIGTFGLQYLLFYKTAAFLNTSLIFFSVFLIIPLFFSAIGGFISTLLSKRQLMFASITALAAAVLLATLDIFSQAHLLIFVLIAILFVYAGFLFPLLIEPISDTEQRAVLYAVNIFAGGLAFLLLVTLHATLGWTLSFTLVTAVLISGVWWLKR